MNLLYQIISDNKSDIYDGVLTSSFFYIKQTYNCLVCSRRSSFKSFSQKISAWVFCVKIRNYFRNLINKTVNDNIKRMHYKKKVIKQLQTMKNYLRRLIHFLSKIVPNLNLNNNLGDSWTNPNITDSAFCAIKKYENHPNILKIKEMMGRRKPVIFLCVNNAYTNLI